MVLILHSKCRINLKYRHLEHVDLYEELKLELYLYWINLVDTGKSGVKNLVDTGILQQKIWWNSDFGLILPKKKVQWEIA